jgi:hypothetical protein
MPVPVSPATTSQPRLRGIRRERVANLQQNAPTALNTEEAAAFLGVADSTLRDWKCQRIGPAYTQYSARCVRYAQADLEKFIADRRVVPSPRLLGRTGHATLRRSR